LQVVPWGFRKVLNWVAKEYNNPPVLITENGFSDHGELDDNNRVDYYIVSCVDFSLTDYQFVF
jgi:beta-glucosidase/6-phospho-beta-glucosidase/beta-galactosidase